MGPECRHLAANRWTDPFSLLFVFDDVNRGFLGGCCAAADTNILIDQFCLGVLAKSPVWRDKSTCSRVPNLTSLGKFSFALGFVGALSRLHRARR